MDDKDDIEEARAAYDALTDSQKAMISDSTYKKLTDAEEALNSLVLIGDADGDGEVTSVDVTFIQRYLAHLDVPEGFNEAAADVDGDGEITSVDVTFIQRYLAFIEVPYPINEYI